MKIYDGAYVVKGRKNKEAIVGDIYFGTFIGCPTELGERVHISANCSFVGQGKLIIEDEVTISPGVVIYTSSPDFVNGSTGNKYIEGFKIEVADVRIKKGAFIGANSVIHQGVTIGENAIIGACSFVNSDVPAGQIWVGRPARMLIKNRNQNENY